MTEAITIIALIAGVAILSISFYKFARSDLKDIDPWHSGAVSLTGVALLGFGLFSEITVNFSDEQSVTLSKIEKLEDDLTSVQEAAVKAADQSAQATEEVQALKESVETNVASVEQARNSITESVVARLDVPRIRDITERLTALEQVAGRIDTLSASLEGQDARLAALSSQMAEMNRKLEALLGRPFPAPQLERLQEGVVGIVYFGHNDTSLSGTAKITLDDIADELQGEEPRTIVVAGHADSSGNPDINQVLARQRAETVARYLVERGLPADGITVVGLGDGDPAVPTAGGTRETLNRRVVISVE